MMNAVAAVEHVGHIGIFRDSEGFGFPVLVEDARVLWGAHQLKIRGSIEHSISGSKWVAAERVVFPKEGA